MSISEQTFADEAVKQLDFLQARGFTGPDVEHGAGPQTPVSIRYRRGPMVFQASLVVVQPRELYVEFTGLVNDGERDVPADENRDLVRTGREMRQALQRQARMIRATMPA